MAGLVIAGHGSHYSPRATRPVFDHADRLRASEAFEEVREAFWHGQPYLGEVLRTIESEVVYVVPLFTSTGYFTDRVLPRELRLGSQRDLTVEKTVHYTPPVGTHDAMTDAIVARAESVMECTNLEGTGLALVGHGTERHDDSAGSALAHAERIRERGRFSRVQALFLDESPRVEALDTHFACRDVVVVPLFVANGRHAGEDIPRAIGVPAEPGEWPGPTRVDSHRVWYAGAVGTEPLLARVIADRAAAAGAEIDPEAVPTTGSPARDREIPVRAPTEAAGRAFLRWLGRTVEAPLSENCDRFLEGGRIWGELAISVSSGHRSYGLRHRQDIGRPSRELDAYEDPIAARELARFDDLGRYRPLKTARSLPRGWVFPALSGPDLLAAVDFFYPATVENWHRDQHGDLDVTHWQEMATRQTGRYADLAGLSSESVTQLADRHCVDSRCCKRRCWDYAEETMLAAARGDGRFPCREPCSLLLAAAREDTYNGR